jgi:phytoene dehydrogenase-like protein
MSKKVIIIGGGIAGLSAGCYARMNGFETEIFEMHSIAGGLCTAWERKGFTFDGCLHWLTGSDPSSLYYPYWEEIGAVQGKQFINYPYFTVVKDGAGNTFTVYTDPGRLREEMLRLAPGDRKLIDRITRDIRTIQKNEMPPVLSFRHIIPVIQSVRMIMKYKEPVRELAGRFKSPVLRDLFMQGLDWGEMCSAFLLWTLALMGAGKAGYPVGGSKGFIGGILERYLQLGGRIRYHARVDGITVSDGKAAGIRLAGGEEHAGDYVISAADGYTTIYRWLEGKYTGKNVEEAYRDFILFPPLVYVSLGFSADYSAEPFSQNITLKKPVVIGGEEVKSLFIRNSSMDPTFAPAGKSVFTLMITANHEYWKDIPYHGDRYAQEKERIGKAVLEALEEIYPEIGSQVEVMDIATPHTFVRYTGNWKGSYEGWLMTAKTLRQRNLMTLPGLQNFYMAGHWVSPGGGLPSGLITGRMVVKKMCKAEGRKFVTSRP